MDRWGVWTGGCGWGCVDRWGVWMRAGVGGWVGGGVDMCTGRGILVWAETDDSCPLAPAGQWRSPVPQTHPHPLAGSVPPQASHVASGGTGQRGCRGPLARGLWEVSRKGCGCLVGRGCWGGRKGGGLCRGCPGGHWEPGRAGQTATQEPCPPPRPWPASGDACTLGPPCGLPQTHPPPSLGPAGPTWSHR